MTVKERSSRKEQSCGIGVIWLKFKLKIGLEERMSAYGDYR